MSVIRILASHRVFLCGRTGSGKTTLATTILRSSAGRWAILDSKEGIDIPNVPIRPSYDRRLAQQIIRQPDRGAGPSYWDDQVYAMWRDGNITIYNDELLLTNASSRNLSQQLGRAIRTGRQRNVAMWTGSQRPKDLPSSVFTETEHFFIFQLTYKADRDKVVSFTGDAIRPLLERLSSGANSGYDFVYYNVLAHETLYVAQRRSVAPTVAVVK